MKWTVSSALGTGRGTSQTAYSAGGSTSVRVTTAGASSGRPSGKRTQASSSARSPPARGRSGPAGRISNCRAKGARWPGSRTVRQPSGPATSGAGCPSYATPGRPSPNRAEPTTTGRPSWWPEKTQAAVRRPDVGAVPETCSGPGVRRGQEVRGQCADRPGSPGEPRADGCEGDGGDMAAVRPFPGPPLGVDPALVLGGGGHAPHHNVVSWKIKRISWKSRLTGLTCRPDRPTSLTD
ncbi:hypothetical protein SGRIM119S_07293 [Streptomyces griseorubiginosus]